ncbi:acetylornithine deacetylase [Trinickia caryophylli]|uniref:Acetylornithine deacetylase n=1 Tax=Trinickia caryophylli TaxID=28094 RepID=A0A1X7DMK0_TRICW|nr:acetylornithine deacetylase [Trinickia caryophylli]PMS10635.1 acetylornithine deacetylase [Trinickia caryophylli]TRX17182.1 acetylornithine deacetylase [Trinickia caryophylli]WQE13818.1 acetylornithine deacetylase [Trinickia caryophylli]SMF18365.1 acetylornithine deacetylase [Trinickia caryophylli]GLU31790.1 acetylornithine deacetylase [Trinickia caryophylli]
MPQDAETAHRFPSSSQSPAPAPFPASPLPLSLQWVERLVSIDTTSRRPNIELIEIVREALSAHGIVSTLTRDERGERGEWANLFATIPAHDGATTGGVVLSGHTDVVPVDGQQWDSDPFRAEIREQRLYGRGTCDMKGFIGAVMALVPEMQAVKLAKPIHLAFSFDEEIGCAGAPLMIAELQRRGVNPDGCIVGEPTSMRPIVAHKGINVYRCCVRGHAAHSSLTPKGLNAIEYAARLICHIRDVADEMRRDGPFDEFYDVPFTTAQTSTIEGGNAVNTVPAECRFAFEFRNLPTLDPATVFERIEHYAQQTLLPQMRREHPDAAIEFTRIASAPGLDATEQAAITELVRALTGDRQTRKVAYGTEAGLFARAGVPSIVCGPGDIEQAHKPNEYVELSQLAACESFLRKFMRSMSVDARA